MTNKETTFGLPGRHTREEAERIYRDHYFNFERVPGELNSPDAQTYYNTLEALSPFKQKSADEIIADIDAALKSEVDPHEYRKAIAEDCIVGICSINNCLYPDCSPKAKADMLERERDAQVKVTFGHSMLFDKVQGN